MSRPSPASARYAIRRPLWSYLAWAGVLLALYVAFFSVDLDEGSLWTFDSRVWDLSSFTDPAKFERAMERLGLFCGAFANPDASPEFIGRAWELVWQTLSTALLGTAIGVVLGYLLALGAPPGCSGWPTGALAAGGAMSGCGTYRGVGSGSG
ncbi:hypothetical protein EDM80_16085, partial [bacterium]